MHHRNLRTSYCIDMDIMNSVIILTINIWTIIYSQTNTTTLWWYLLTASANEERNISVSFQPEFLCTILPVKQNSTNGTGYCKCVSGYWGASCQNECPGGASNPCYGKGLCDPVNGSCTCFTGVNSTEKCQTCDENWIGTDCSVATTDKGKHVDVSQIDS